MKEDHFTVVGLGLIGSSLGAALRRAGVKVTGYDARLETLDTARRLGHIETASESLEAAVAGADLVVLAVPIPAILELLAPVTAAAPHAVVVDVGSVKRPIVDRMALLPAADRCIGGHPVAGKETSGPEAADSGLFRNRPFALVPNPRTSDHTRQRALDLVRMIGARPVETDVSEHDSIVARTSHLPQVVSTVLAEALKRRDVDLAGPGLGSMVRLALSDPTLWRGILLENREHVVGEIRALAIALADFAGALEREDGEAVMQHIERGREAARRLRLDMPR